ncbi:hypothetical protein [uncultured Endozoicomonas sp.]|nr:hypothetical protein [uncultured Endozoicomonas sp.]
MKTGGIYVSGVFWLQGYGVMSVVVLGVGTFLMNDDPYLGSF